MSRTFEYDVFLSYSSKDKKTVHALAERLKKDGLRVWLDMWEIKPGDMIGLKIQHGLEQSRTLIMCMSQCYFDSEWGTAEHHTLLFRDPTNTQRRFIPLLIKDCTLPDIIAQFKYIDWRKPTDEEYKELITACQGNASNAKNTMKVGISISTKVIIESPIANSRVNHAVPLRGIVENLPADKELWVVKEIAKGNYHPDNGPADIKGNTWKSTAYVGNNTRGADTGITFTIHIVMASHETGVKFKNYINQALQNGNWSGIDTIYDGEKLATVEVIRDDSAPMINISDNSHRSLGQLQQIDDTDFRILQAIQDLRVSIPNADKINARLNLNPEELGARIGAMHSKGFIKAEWGSHMPGVSLPNGIYAAGLTDQGKMALIKRNKN